MKTFSKIMTSQEARAGWRDLLEEAIKGNAVAITRYGRSVAVLVPYDDYLQALEANPQGDTEGAIHIHVDSLDPADVAVEVARGLRRASHL